MRCNYDTAQQVAKFRRSNRHVFVTKMLKVCAPAYPRRREGRGCMQLCVCFLSTESHLPAHLHALLAPHDLILLTEDDTDQRQETAQHIQFLHHSTIGPFVQDLRMR